MVKKIIRKGGGQASDAVPKSIPWRVLVVDDDPDILNLTRISLSDFHFDGRPVELCMATSGTEAQKILHEQQSFAVAFIDVVMETPDAGLQLVKFIRDTLKDKAIRLVIRTGQPGMAPERIVIDTYDIDDYKEKTELTAWKLYTTLRSSIKSYRDLMAVEYNRMGLARILEAAPEFYRYRSLEQFLDGVLHQMSTILPSNYSGFLVGTHENVSAIIASPMETNTCRVLENMQVRCGLGRFATDVAAQNKVLQRCIQILHDQAENYALTIDEFGNVITPVGSQGQLFGVVYLELNRSLTAEDRQFLEIFAMQCGAALENLQLFGQLENSRNQLQLAHRHAIYMLAVASEYKDKETGNHIQRIAHYTRAIAEHLSLPVEECAEIAIASVLHDLGKISIPDAILHKPGRLSAEEFAIIRTHCMLGSKILGDTHGFRLAHDIALQHHEKWDGSGYPAGLRGVEIALPARIVAVADVFDALVSERPYKQAWSVEAAVVEIENQAHRHFDPEVVRAFLAVHASGQLDRIRAEIG
ncbi:MAG: DUF3369 domain-containing protein [Magnetococcales bacterium]|nr:DUF3369 domain-containing protein [Magnetococcales bacterium]NGZ05296.1 DUF3369 domain-containing protein [Magnetococcales bacterium]